MPPLFISHDSVDNNYVLELSKKLRDKGYDVWLDKENILNSSRWAREIAKAIPVCSAMIVIMTPEAEESDWVHREILLAQKHKKAIFPLLLRGEEFPILIDIQFADVRHGGLPTEEFFNSLPKDAKNGNSDIKSEPVLTSSNEKTSYPQIIQRWRVSQNQESNERGGVIVADAGQINSVGDWELKTPDSKGRGVYGPYVILKPNKYHVTFRLKIDDITGKDERLAFIDVTSRMAEKEFTRRTLTVKDFLKSDTYQDFYLTFDLNTTDENFEFRIRTNPTFEARKLLSLDYIELKAKHSQKFEFILGNGEVVRAGELMLNIDTKQLVIDDKIVQLTSTESRLLHYFMDNAGFVISSGRLLQDIWDYPANTGDPDLVRAHVRNLNSKTKKLDKEYIRTVKDVGYMLLLKD